MLAFVHVAKTGGRTIESMLRSSFGANYCDAASMKPKPCGDYGTVKFTIPKYTPDDLRFIKSIMPGMKSIGGHHVALWSDVEDVFPDTKYFLFLREPLKRGASHYQFHVNNDDYTNKFGFKNFSWDKWVEWETHHNHQLKMLSPDVEVEQAIKLIDSKNVFVGLMEHFDESLVMMKKLLCPELNIAYTRKNSAQNNSLAKSLLENKKSCDQIREMYADEFPLYEYVKNELFPGYRKEYGSTLENDLEKYLVYGKNKINKKNLLINSLYKRFVFKPRLKKHRGIYY